MTSTAVICMVGSSNIDLIARVPRLPGPGETLIGSRFQIGYGGKGANQAVMAAKLGARVSVVTKVGRDIFGEGTLKNYQDHGIETAHCLFDDERFSGVAPIQVDEHTGQNSIVIVPGANDGLSPADVERAAPAIAAAQVLICQLEIPIATTRAALETARAAGVTTVLNPAPAAALDDAMLALSDYFIPNEVEAAMLTGLPTATDAEAEAAARALMARGAGRNGAVILTLGARGALVLTPDSAVMRVHAEPVQAVDTTGAGDAFVGSFAVLVAEGRALADAVRLACAAATRSVLRPGTQVSFPTRADLAALLG